MVKKNECQKPFDAFVAYLPMKFAGVWQLLQVATAAVRRLEPAVEFLLHDMAVGAGRRIIGEVGPTLGIGESVYADADGDADNHAEQDALDSVTPSSTFVRPTLLYMKVDCYASP